MGSSIVAERFSGERKEQSSESEEMNRIHGLEGRISQRCMLVLSVGHGEVIYHGYSIKHPENILWMVIMMKIRVGEGELEYAF